MQQYLVKIKRVSPINVVNYIDLHEDDYNDYLQWIKSTQLEIKNDVQWEELPEMLVAINELYYRSKDDYDQFVILQQSQDYYQRRAEYEIANGIERFVSWEGYVEVN
jgi:hypothetical protein